MVAMNGPNDRGRKIDGAICPGCDEHYMYPSVSNKGPDKYGRELREVSGWCLKCDIGYIVRQFLSEGKWLTYEYRKYIYNQNGGPKTAPVGPWMQGYSLPEPAPVIVGPGGDFVKQIDLDPEVGKVLQAALDILNKTGKAIVELINIAKKADGAKHD